jgi:hypothetical protein
MTYKTISLAAGIFLLCVSSGLLLFPSKMLLLWEINPLPEAAFMGRRLAMEFIGIATLCILARNLPDSDARRIISIAIVVAFGILSILGFSEFFRGFVGTGIIPAASLEMLFALGFYFLGVKKK